MPDFHDVIERIHYVNRRDYTSRKGSINYLDATPLTRPSFMPASQRLIAIGIVVVAIIIGLVLINRFVISHWQETEAAEKAIETNLARPASIETIPIMPGMINLDDNAIKATFEGAGLTIYDASAKDESNDLTLFRVPADMTTDEMASFYLTGLAGLEAKDASKYFEGGWMFAADRTSGTTMVVRYADFSTGDPQIAVQNAIVKEGFDTTTISESGEDESGNTYSSGTFAIDETTTGTWKVSALPFKDVYSIPGLPENACYVGVRVTRA